MEFRRPILKRPWINSHIPCPNFMLQQQYYYANTQPSVLNQGWPTGYARVRQGYTTTTTTSQYNVFRNQVVGGFYPQFRTKGAYLCALDAVAFDPSIDVPFNVCFSCWQLGHSHPNCPQPKTNRFCNNCGRIGVTVNTCPRCARAYSRFLLKRQAQKVIGMDSAVQQVSQCLQLNPWPKAYPTTKFSNFSPANETALNRKSERNQRDPSTHLWHFTRTVKGDLFEDINPIPFDRKVDVPHGVCFNCWQYGHSRPKCPEPDRQDHCRNCGRIGVKVDDCPRCSSAYHRHRQEHRDLQFEESPVIKKEDCSGEYDEAILEFIAKRIAEDKEENYDDVIVDEDEESFVITGAFLKSFLHLKNATKFLSLEEQKNVAQNYIREHCTQVLCKES